MRRIRVAVVFAELEAISPPPATAAKLPTLLAFSLELVLPPLFPDTNPDVKAGIPEPGLFDFFSLSLTLASLTDALHFDRPGHNHQQSGVKGQELGSSWV